MTDINRRNLLGALGAAALTAQTGVSKPNILFLCSDQHTSGALGANGHPIVRAVFAYR